MSVYTLFLLGGVLLLLNIRVGINDLGAPVFDWLGNKEGFAGFDVDLTPDLLGVLLLLILAARLARENRHMNTAKNLLIAMIPFSLLTTVQLSGFKIFELFPGSYNWVFNPTFLSEFAFGALELILLILTVIALGCLMDGMLDLAEGHSTEPNYRNALAAADWFRKGAALPVILKLVCDVVARDSLSDAQLGQKNASVTLIVLRVLWAVSLVLLSLLVVYFSVAVRPEE